jgi:hypothetical protein
MSASETLTVVEVATAWDRLLIEAILLKDHPVFALFSTLGPPQRNRSVDLFAPGLLYIKMGAILDAALKAAIRTRSLPSNPRDLYGRINLLDEENLLIDPGALHRIRDLRNDLAHGTATKTDWKTFETDTATVHAELRNLGIVAGELPTFVTSAERTSEIDPRPGIAVILHHLVRVKQGGQVRFEQRWSTAHHYVDDVDDEAGEVAAGDSK